MKSREISQVFTSANASKHFIINNTHAQSFDVQILVTEDIHWASNSR